MDTSKIDVYKKLNNSFLDKRLVFSLTNRGFASEVNNMALVILYCLDHKIQFCLNDNSWNSGKWTDYFLEFCMSYKSWLILPDFVFSSSKTTKIKKYIFKLLYPKTIFLDKNLWNHIRSESFFEKEFLIPQLQIQGDIFSTKREIIKMLFNYNQNTKDFLNIHRISLQDFAAIHIRRGDKLINEAQKFEVEDYIQIHVEKKLQTNKFFIASDSFDVIREFTTKYPNKIVETNIEEGEGGHLQSTFNKQDKKTRYYKTLGVIKDIDALSRSESFVGTYSSNIGRLVCLLRNNQKCYSVDNEWSPT